MDASVKRHIAALVRAARVRGTEFRVVNRGVEVRGLPDELRPALQARRFEVREYLLLHREHGATCRRCGGEPIQRLSDAGLCWRCLVESCG
jgi:hypothetical protein